MRPSKAAIETARTLIGEYYSVGKPSPAAMTQILQAAYAAQFGNETLYRPPSSDCRHEYVADEGTCTDCGAWLAWVVPVEGDDDE